MTTRMMNKMAELIEREFDRHYARPNWSIVQNLLLHPPIYEALEKIYGPQAEREIEWEDANEAYEKENPTRYIISKDGGFAWYYPETKTIGEFRVIDKL